MCGIVVLLGQHDLTWMKVALSRLVHRGENGSQILVSGDALFGFNRLAINDPSMAGMQPFQFQDWTGVFNGEIYNAAELKKTFGIETASDADTEVILPLFVQLGAGIVHFLDGFYAGVIHNQKTGEMFVLRDVMGKKPLFFCQAGKRRFLTSELKVSEEIDQFELLPLGFSTLQWENAVLLEPHRIVAEGKYELRHRLVEAVRKRIPAHGAPFGEFLSGGLDSSIVASIVASMSDKATYYTLGGVNALDVQYVQRLAIHLGITASLNYIPLPSLDTLPALVEQVVYHTESYNPSIISNGLSTYIMAAAARKNGLDVVLTGEGADELFCGYPISKDRHHWFTQRNSLIADMQYTELRRLDLASMAHTIEARCPFLDRKVIAAARDCNLEDLISAEGERLIGKSILRKACADLLPDEIINRPKVSFDVGSGMRKIVIDYLRQTGNTERNRLKEIWVALFPLMDAMHPHFSKYPVFDAMIDQRGAGQK
jgi:asparagine synthase (glutamine-hydrolysing)